MSYYLGFEPTDQSNFFFASYNNEDAARVASLTCEMAKIGIPLWYDYGIEYGRKWASQINEKISASQAMILFFTKGILLKEDSYVQKEFKIARLLKKKIIVLMLDEIESTEIPTSKLDWWIDITDNQCLNVYLLTEQEVIIGEVKRALGITTTNQDDKVALAESIQWEADKKKREQADSQLYFTWLIDCSGSMSGYRIATVNFAVQNAIRSMRDMAMKNHSLQLMIGTISFSSGARWVTHGYIKAEEYSWQDLEASGCTDVGKALELVTDELAPQKPDEYVSTLSPVFVLLTDGFPTDDYKNALNRFNSQAWRKKPVKIAIAIGRDVDWTFLEEFTGNKELVLHADTAQELIEQIKWVSAIPSNYEM